MNFIKKIPIIVILLLILSIVNVLLYAFQPVIAKYDEDNYTILVDNTAQKGSLFNRWGFSNYFENYQRYSLNQFYNTRNPNKSVTEKVVETIFGGKSYSSIGFQGYVHDEEYYFRGYSPGVLYIYPNQFDDSQNNRFALDNDGNLKMISFAKDPSLTEIITKDKAKDLALEYFDKYSKDVGAKTSLRSEYRIFIPENDGIWWEDIGLNIEGGITETDRYEFYFYKYINNLPTEEVIVIGIYKEGGQLACIENTYSDTLMSYEMFDYDEEKLSENLKKFISSTIDDRYKPTFFEVTDQRIYKAMGKYGVVSYVTVTYNLPSRWLEDGSVEYIDRTLKFRTVTFFEDMSIKPLYKQNAFIVTEGTILVFMAVCLVNWIYFSIKNKRVTKL